MLRTVVRKIYLIWFHTMTWNYVVVGPLCAHCLLCQADAGNNEAKVMMKHAPEWILTSDPVLRIPKHYMWTTGPTWCPSVHNIFSMLDAP